MTPERWQRVDAIFLEAIETPPEERAAFLDAACGADQELRREVEVLLAHDSTVSGFHSAVGAGLAALNDKQATSLVGGRIGQYRLESLLGRGGMGAVYLGTRDDEFRQQVAIKLLHPGLSSEAVVRRFRQERQILARLQHPNVAKLLDGGSTEDGQPFFAMEYVPGTPITRYCREQKLSVRKRLALFGSVCSAVQYAHQNLVVHRDLKPGNILVTDSGDVKLLDFGIAKLVGNTEWLIAEEQTATGTFLLTPEYASPEQVRGEPVTTASDIYSLGVVLYELLSGQKAQPLDGRSPAEIAEAVCVREPEKPSVAAARDPETRPLARELEGDLDNIVLKALRKEPQHRYGSVEQLASDIRRHLDGQPVTARGNHLGYRAGKFVKRNRVAVVAAALVAISILAGAGVAVYQARRAERRLQQVRQLANTFLFDFHDKIKDLQGATPAREFVVQTALRYLDSLSKEAGNDNDLRAELAAAYLRVGNVQGEPRLPNLGKQKDAIESYRKAIPLAEKALDGDPTNLGILRTLVMSHANLGDLEELTLGRNQGRETLKKGIAYAERAAALPNATGSDRSSLANVTVRLGDAILDEDPRGAMKLYEGAIAQAEKLVAEDPADGTIGMLTTFYDRMGRGSSAIGDPVRAIAYYQKAIPLAEKIVARNPDNGPYRRQLSLLLTMMANNQGNPSFLNAGDPKSALVNYQKAREMDDKMLQSDKGNLRQMLDFSIGAARRSDVLREIDPARSLEEGRTCASMAAQVLAVQPDNRHYRRVAGQCRNSLSAAYIAAGQPRQALPILKEIRETAQADLAADPKSLPTISTFLLAEERFCKAYIQLQDWQSAKAHCDSFAATAKKQTEELPEDAYYARDLAEAYELQGHFYAVSKAEGPRRAAEEYRKAIAAWERFDKLTVSSALGKQGKARAQRALSQLESK